MAVLLAAAATACGGKKPYKIDGTVEGLGTQNVTAVFYDGQCIREITTNAVNSKFHIEGNAEQPVVMELYDKQRNRIGCLVAQNGNEIAVKYKAGDPSFMEASGNELSAGLASFLKQNGKNLNAAIEKSIATSPASDLTAILAGYYYDINGDAARADSLLALVKVNTPTLAYILESRREIASRMGAKPEKISEVRMYSSNDTVIVYEPSAEKSTLFLFSDDNKMPDSIINYIDSVAKEYRIAAVRMSVDSFGWGRERARFPKDVDHFWTVGGVANENLRQFNIPRLPYFVVVDTASNQIYRGSSLP